MTDFYSLYFNTELAENHFGVADYSLFLNRPIGTPIDENYTIGLKSIFMCNFEDSFILSSPIRIVQQRLTPHPTLDETIPAKTKIYFNSVRGLLENLLKHFSIPNVCTVSTTPWGLIKTEVREGFILHLSKEICNICGFLCSSTSRAFHSKNEAEFHPSPPPSLCYVESNLTNNSYFGQFPSPIHECLIPTKNQTYFKYEFTQIKYFPIEFCSFTHINVKFRDINLQLYTKALFPIILEFVLSSKLF